MKNRQYMKAWFDFRDGGLGTILYYLIIILTVVCFLSPIILIFMEDIGLEVSKDSKDISIILLMIGVFWLTGFLYPIIYNDIYNLTEER